MPKFVIDMYGGDNGPEVVVKGALKVLSDTPELELVFAGDKEIVDRIGKENNADFNRISYLNTTSFVSNHDNPKLIFKGFNDSSLVLGLEACKNDDSIDGIISCGCTGAVVIGSIFRLGLLPGVQFPCLAAAVFTFTDKRVLILDCGAVVDCKSANLVSFAKYGTAFMKACYEIEKPRVGLLNVGKEDEKGNVLMKETFPLLKESGLNFIGNVEGSDILDDSCDVCVCDGFSGNVVIKLAESVGLNSMKESNGSTALYKRFAYNDLGCSMLIGAKKIVAKAHGKANELTIENSLRQAIALAKGGFISKLKETL